MKIAYISYEHPCTFPGGGIGTYIDQIASIMGKRGHVVEVFIANPLSSEVIDCKNYIIHCVKAHNFDEFRNLVVEAFSRSHLARKFDIIESPEYGADALHIKKIFPEIPLVVKLHTPSYLTQKLNHSKLSAKAKARFMVGGLIRGQWAKPYWKYTKGDDNEYLLFRLADTVYSPSKSLSEIIKKDWASPKEIEVIANPYSPSRTFIELPVANHRGNELIISFIGRLEQRKGILDLMMAIPEILKYSREIRFRFIGKSHPSPMKGLNMEEYIKKHLKKYQANLEFYGAQPYEKIPLLLSQTDVCIFPSLWENFPNVCLEAMMAGRAVIGTNQGGMAEMIKNNVSGLLINSSSPKEIVSAVKELHSHPTKVEFLGRKARERVLAEYNDKKIGALTEVLYNNTLLKVKKRVNQRQNA